MIAEIYKQIANSGVQARLYHLRTHDGKEVDLLIEMPDHYLAFEIKMTSKVSKADSKNLTGLDAIMGVNLKLIQYLGNYTHRVAISMAMCNMKLKLQSCFDLIDKVALLPVLEGLTSMEVWQRITPIAA